MGSIPRWGNGNPLQYSCLEKSHGQRRLVGYSHGVAKSWIQLRTCAQGYEEIVRVEIFQDSYYMGIYEEISGGEKFI